MHAVGEYVVYGSKGVCVIEEVKHVDMPGASKDRLYYIMHPVHDKSGTVYLPTDSQKQVLRSVVTSEEAKQLVQDIPNIEPLWVASDKKREEAYKNAMRACEGRTWISIIKALYSRKCERIAAGKKITALDERFLKAAEHELCGELSVALSISMEEAQKCIYEQLTK